MHKKRLIQTCCAAVLAIAPFSLLQAKPTGTLKTVSGIYTLAPKTCTIYKDDDFYDIEVHGPGTGPGGEKVYAELSSTGDSLSVGLGVDSMFDSADKTMRSEGKLQIHVDGSKIRAVEIKLVDQDQQVVDTNATLEIDCSRD